MAKKIEIFTEPVSAKEFQGEGVYAGYFKGKGMPIIGEGTSAAGYLAKERLGRSVRVVGAMIVSMGSDFRVEIDAATVNPQLKDDRIEATAGALVGAAVGYEQFLGLSVEVDSDRRKEIAGQLGDVLGLELHGAVALQEVA